MAFSLSKIYSAAVANPDQMSLIRPAMLKIERSRHHALTLRALIDEYKRSDPVKWIESKNEFSGKIENFARIKIPIPDEVSLIAGDAIHNARTALDVIVYGIVTNSGGDFVEHKIQFPFAATKVGLESAIRRSQLGGCGQSVLNQIASICPCGDGDDLLYKLHLMDIRDKHKINLSVSEAVTIKAPDFMKAGIIEPFPVESVTVTGGARAVRSIPRPNRAMRRANRTSRVPFERETAVQPGFEIIFGEGPAFQGDALLPKLDAWIQRVEEVVSLLDKAFIEQRR